MADTHDPMTPAEDAAKAARRGEVVSVLTALGLSRREALQIAAESTASMKPYVREAVELGLMPTQLERLTGVSRRAIYDWIADDARPDEAAGQP